MKKLLDYLYEQKFINEEIIKDLSAMNNFPSETSKAVVEKEISIRQGFVCRLNRAIEKAIE